MKNIMIVTIFVTLMACGSEPQASYNQEEVTEAHKQASNVGAHFTGETQYSEEAQALVNAGWFDATKCMGIGDEAYATLQNLRNDMPVSITSNGTCDPLDAGIIQVNVDCNEGYVARQILRYIGAVNACY